MCSGCFEHYLNLRVHDATFQRYESALEWLSAFDTMSGAMRSEREYALMPYLPYTVVPFFPLFAERGGPKVERPKADWEVRFLTSEIDPDQMMNILPSRITLRRALTKRSTIQLPKQVVRESHGAALIIGTSRWVMF